jgi:hypothetical protein
MRTQSYIAGYLAGYMHKHADAGMGEVTVNKDSMYERNPLMIDNKDQYPKYPERKEWEKKLYTLKRKLNFDGINGLPSMGVESTGAGTERNKESYA